MQAATPQACSRAQAQSWLASCALIQASSSRGECATVPAPVSQQRVPELVMAAISTCYQSKVEDMDLIGTASLIRKTVDLIRDVPTRGWGRVDNPLAGVLARDCPASCSAPSRLPAIRAAHLAEIELLIPPLSERQAIAAALSGMEAEIPALERRLDKTHGPKQGMMQPLLTSSIRLPLPHATFQNKSN